MKGKNTKKLIIAVVVLAVLIAAAVGIYFATRPATTAGAKEITVVVAYDDEEITHDIKTDAETLGEALIDEKIVEDNQTEYGLYIITADGRTADEGIQEWWCITQDGEMLMTGADSTPIENGDHFELTLTVGW